MSDLIELTKQLIAVESVSPNDNNCQKILIERLEKVGFAITELPHGDVSNFWAKRGETQPLFMFAGHTDVVPTGPVEKWNTPPFEASVKNDFLYGRGAADMKGALAAMICATEKFIQQFPKHKGAIGFAITSGEEGDEFDEGTPKIMAHLHKIDSLPQWCLVGEPSCKNDLGDTLRVGRRGSLTAYLKVIGQQGHVAYPHHANNPIHPAMAALNAIANEKWDEGNEFFAPTSLQITNIAAGTGAGNVIPAHLTAQFNLRFSTEITAKEIEERLTQLLEQHCENVECRFRVNGEPFLTKAQSPLVIALQKVIQDVCGEEITPDLSTGGGTSDARFIAPYCENVIEFGVCNKTIHQVNECVKLEELERLQAVYYGLLCQMLGS